VFGGKKESTIRNFIFADNRVGDATTWETYYDQILWVMGSDNYSDDYAHEPVGGDVSAAHIVYDGPVITTNSHFSGVTRPTHSILDQWGANIKYTSHSFENTTADEGAVRYNWRRESPNSPVWFLATVRDIDGALTGIPNSTISKNHPFLMDATSVQKSDNGTQSDLKFAYVELVYGTNLPRPRPDASVLRADGEGRQYSDQGSIEGYPISVVVDRPEMRSRFVYKESIPHDIEFEIYSLAPGEDIMWEVANVPRTARLNDGGFVPQLGTKTIEALANATNQGASWYWKDGTVYIKYKGLNSRNYLDAEVHDIIDLCITGNCGAGSSPVIISDFAEKDTRGSVVKNGSNAIGTSAITNSNGQDRYTITKQGANDACAEYVLRFGVQNWRDMGRLNIQGSGLEDSEIYVYNSVTNEQRRIGIACSNNRFTSDIPNDSFYDNIAELSIKTCESRMSGNSQQITIDRIIMGNLPNAGPTAQNCGNPTTTDCNAAANGDAYRDDCGECVGGNTGQDDCDSEPITPPNEPNNPPSGRLTSPSNGDTFGVGEPITIRANGTDTDGQVVRYSFFYNNTNLIESVIDGTNSTTTSFAEPGTYILTVRVADNDDAVTISDQVTITVTEEVVTPPTNNGPDTDGDGTIDSAEDAICSNPNNASDLRFDFNGTDEGFEKNNIAAQSTVNGNTLLLRTDNNNDPQVIRNRLNFNGSQTPQLRIRTKSEAAGSYQLFWSTATQSAFNQSRSVIVSPQTTNEFEELVFDMSGFNTWMGQTITSIRLDFPPSANASAHTWIDYIYGPDTNDDGCSQTTISFVSPTNLDLTEGDDLGVIIFAASGGGDSNGQNISNVRLYLNGTLVRQEDNIPYEWGNEHSPTIDPILRNLSSGTYVLEALVTNNDGVETSETLTITVAPEGNPIVHISKANAPGFAIDGNDDGAKGQNVYLWASNIDNENQQWEEINQGGGYYSYRKLNTNFALDGGNGGDEGQNLHLWTYDEENLNQHWRKIVTPNGNIRLEKRNASSVSINGGDNGARGQNVFLSGNNANGGNQEWIFEVVGNVSSFRATQTSTNDIKVYPNPTKSYINVDLEENNNAQNILILNVIGKIIKSVPSIENTTTIDLSDLSNGMYFVKIDGKKQSEIIKIIKN